MGLLKTYERAVSCTTGPQTGAKALMAWVLGAFGPKGATNLGIFNCRPIRGTNNTTSLHGEGRACDFGFPVGDPDGDVLQQLLLDHSEELGIQCIIYERHIWSGAHWDEGLRPYGGTNPHIDHLHVELSWNAARSLTAEMIEAVLGNATVVLPAAVVAARGPRNLRIHDRGTDVGSWQQELNRMGYATRIDDVFGPETDKLTREFQIAAGIEGDGVVGKNTRAMAALVPSFPGLTVPSKKFSAATKAFQARLIARGWNLGKWKDDGKHGDQTTKALKAFQAEKKLPDVDGKGGRDTWVALFTRGGAVR